MATPTPAGSSARLPAPSPAGAVAIKAILVATDFSDASSKPLRHAISIARHFGAKLYLAHVVSSLGYTIAGADTIESVAQAARIELDRLEKQLVATGALDGIPHEFIVRQGDVWEQLQASPAKCKRTP